MSLFDAVILGDAAPARVLGLTLVERARRVAIKVGARRVLVAGDRDELAHWNETRGMAALLIIRAGDQVVHIPLVEPLLRGHAERRVAVGANGYAGAIFARGSSADAAIEMLAAGRSDRDLAAAWTDAEQIRHGDIARHPATTPAERTAATRMLLRLLVKPEDGPVTRWIYRPISRRLTRALVWTPITPNQVSIAVAIIGMIGCWLTAQRGHPPLILGAALVLIAGFIDGCDGEIARLRLTSSRVGAWLDTIVDEMTTTMYFLAIGYHTYLEHPAAWVAPSMGVGMIGYALTIYGIYYFLIVVSKTGNSQHYVSDLEIVERDGGIALRPKPPGPSNAPPWLATATELLKQGVRRDFINLGALALALVNAYLVIYLGMLAGGMVSAVVVTSDHVRLRVQLRELARRGGQPRLVA